MQRRDFILRLGAAALGLPVAARAQQAVPVIGFLNSVSPQAFARSLDVFRRGLKEAGYAEGQNVTIEYRWAEGDYSRLPALAAELARLNVAVIVTTGGSASALAAQRATATIPIVFTVGGDPVKLGLVESLSRPGGNITGVNLLVSELVSKRMELLRELVPNANLIAMLVNPNAPIAAPDAAAAREAAERLGRRLIVIEAGAESDFERAFASLPQGVGALIVDGDPFFDTRTDKLVDLAARYALPAIYIEPEYPAAGGLASYGPAIMEAYRQVGVYAGRVLRGESPARLPVVQLSKVELVINLKTAKTLGLAVPQSLTARADEVIE